MGHRILIAAIVLFPLACGDGTGPSGAGQPTGTCVLHAFEFADTAWGMQLGPELASYDSLPLEVKTLSANRAEFAGSTLGIAVRFASLTTDPPPDGDRVDWFPLVSTGEYRGTLRAEADSLLWNFDDDGRSISWMTFAGWRVSGRSYRATWRGVGWYLDSEVRCR